MIKEHTEDYKRRKAKYDNLLVGGTQPNEAYAIAFEDMKNGVKAFENEEETYCHRAQMDFAENRQRV